MITRRNDLPGTAEAFARVGSLQDFPGFVCRVIRSAVRDEARRTGNRYDVPAEELRRQVDASIDVFRLVVSMLSRAEYRAATLRYQDGLSQAEVVRLLGVSQPTVSRRLFSVQKQLISVVKQRILPPEATS